MIAAYEQINSWPPLAWLAKLADHDTVEVRHGAQVETHPTWFGEIVWDADFSCADFDKTDIVFGSGGRIRKKSLEFVSSATSLDRLHSIAVGGITYVSNSLACLMAETDADLDARSTIYSGLFTSIIRGLDEYRNELPTTAGKMRLTYYHNLLWSENGLMVQKKPTISRQRNSFAEYQCFLEDALCRIATNMSSDVRRHKYSFLATLSTGFDSPTVAALARTAGLSDTISMRSSRQGELDSGHEIANRLQLNSHVFDREAWKQASLAEIPFLAADAKGEDVFLHGAESRLNGRVLLTGYMGSTWGGKQPYDELRRTDQSGLSLSEYRLWSGFINLPVPTISVFGAVDLDDLMHSDEAKNWRQRPTYDKPFCRMVLAEAGVPGHLFGQQKKAGSILIHDRTEFLSEASRVDFYDHLRQCGLRGDLRAAPIAAKRHLSLASRTAVRVAQKTAKAAGPLMTKVANSSKLAEFSHVEPYFFYLFPWAIHHAKKRYQTPGN